MQHDDVMKSRRTRFTRAHLYIFVSFYLAFAGFTAWVLSRQSESDRRENWNVAATLGTVSGPFTGAIARRFQSCCWKFSLSIFPYCAAVLAVGVMSQLVPMPAPSIEKPLRLTLWSLGLLGWFAGAVVSFGHALS